MYVFIITYRYLSYNKKEKKVLIKGEKSYNRGRKKLQ